MQQEKVGLGFYDLSKGDAEPSFFPLSVFAAILRFRVFQSRKFAYMLMSEFGIRSMLMLKLKLSYHVAAASSGIKKE